MVTDLMIAPKVVYPASWTNQRDGVINHSVSKTAPIGTVLCPFPLPEPSLAATSRLTLGQLGRNEDS